MKIAVACFYSAYPPGSGCASVTYNLAKYWPGDRVLLQLGQADGDSVTEDGVRIITLKGATEWPPGRLLRLPGFVRRIADALREWEPDAVVLEGASWAVYHWLLLRRLRRKTPGIPVAYHAHNVEYVLRKQRHGKAVQVLTRWAEGRVLRAADTCFAVSDADSRLFQELYGVRTELLPNGVDMERFGLVSAAELQRVREEYSLGGARNLLYMGMYSYKPNREGIDFLVRDVMPDVVCARPDVRLHVIGGQIPYSEPWLCNPGQIPYDRLHAFIGACDVGLAPIFSGSGTRLKILEYMAAGLPVVSTRKGAEGLAVRDGRDILFAEHGVQFAQAIQKLVQEDDCARLLGSAGRDLVKHTYGWERISAEFARHLKRLIAKVP